MKWMDASANGTHAFASEWFRNVCYARSLTVRRLRHKFGYVIISNIISLFIYRQCLFQNPRTLISGRVTVNLSFCPFRSNFWTTCGEVQNTKMILSASDVLQVTVLIINRAIDIGFPLHICWTVHAANCGKEIKYQIDSKSCSLESQNSISSLLMSWTSIDDRCLMLMSDDTFKPTIYTSRTLYISNYKIFLRISNARVKWLTHYCR